MVESGAGWRPSMVHNTILPLAGRQVSVPRQNGTKSGATGLTDSLGGIKSVLDAHLGTTFQNGPEPLKR